MLFVGFLTPQVLVHIKHAAVPVCAAQVQPTRPGGFSGNLLIQLV